MEYEQIFSLINNVGFPIFICLYLIKKAHKTEDRLLKVIENNTKAITEFNVKNGGMKNEKRL